MVDPVALATGREFSRVKKLIQSFTNERQMTKAVEDTERAYLDFLIQMAAVFESRVGASLDDISEEDRGAFAKMLAGAILDLVSEMDPERLRFLAASMLGVTLASLDRPTKAAVWRVLKQIDPGAVKLLALHLPKLPYTELGANLLRIQTPEDRSQIDTLERGFESQLVLLRCIEVSETMEVNQDMMHGRLERRRGGSQTPEPKLNTTVKKHRRITDLGTAVLETLVLFSKKKYPARPTDSQMSLLLPCSATFSFPPVGTCSTTGFK